MTDEIEVVRGSGHVFRDLGLRDADLLELRAVLADRILDVLDARGWSVREAQAATGFQAADFSRLRRPSLGGFTVDRLMRMLAALGQEVDVEVSVHAPGTRRAAKGKGMLQPFKELAKVRPEARKLTKVG